MDDAEYQALKRTLEQRASDNLKISCGDRAVKVSFGNWDGTAMLLVEGPSALIGYAHIGGEWRDGYEWEAFAKAARVCAHWRRMARWLRMGGFREGRHSGAEGV